MQVFVTGGSGHIGSAVIPELLEAGHQVVGLARSDGSARALESLGATVRRGDLDDLEVLAASAASADGVVHLAFRHDAMRAGDSAGAIASDLRAIQAMGAALEGSGRPLVISSGGNGGVMGRPGTERDVASGGRADTENVLIGFAERGVRSIAVRNPLTVHSTLDRHGFIPTLIGIARDRGVAAYVGDGSNRWPAVHTLDAANLFRLALEAAPPGSRLHAVADEGIPFRRIAETIGRQLDVPVVSIAPEEAAVHFGFLGAVVSLDSPTSSRRTRELLGWTPTHPGLIDDLEEGHYFAGAS